jgi:diadenosine tetraphosphate (Ap4A) HIT family hydrolase
VFILDPAFTRSSDFLVRLPLCEVRLQSDSRFPWLVLIPRLPGLREVDDLSHSSRATFLEEVIAAGSAVRAMGLAVSRPVEKLNIGVLGNITPQLHAHVVGRRSDDAAWPGPVWGHGGAEPHDPNEIQALSAAAVRVLGTS